MVFGRTGALGDKMVRMITKACSSTSGWGGFRRTTCTRLRLLFWAPSMERRNFPSIADSQPPSIGCSGKHRRSSHVFPPTKKPRRLFQANWVRKTIAKVTATPSACNPRAAGTVDGQRRQPFDRSARSVATVGLGWEVGHGNGGRRRSESDAV